MQVFDKALTEPTFCEIYSSLCYDLNQVLPEFEGEEGEEAPKKINFRRTLLNKCQEEFEEGAAAFRAVKAREIADAERDAKVGSLALIFWAHPLHLPSLASQTSKWQAAISGACLAQRRTLRWRMQGMAGFVSMEALEARNKQ